jgi:hypothetical protein
LANKLLEKQLNKHGYQQSKLVCSLWKHDTLLIQFTFVVDNFGVKYKGKEHPQHLKNTLKEHYKLTCDWTGTQYIGITLDWDYKKHQVHLSMPNYMKKSLKQFHHIAGKLQHLPYPAYLFNMVQRSNKQRRNQMHLCWTTRPNDSFNRYAAKSYSLAEQWTAPYFT